MNKILIGLVFMMAIGMASASVSTLGTFKQDSCVNLIQSCSNCSYVNISSVLNPKSVEVLGEVEMTKDGTQYNYTFCSPNSVGTYIVNGFGDPDGILTTYSYNFNVTSNGDEQTNTIGFYFLIIVLLFVLLAVGFYTGDKWIVVISGMGMIALGFYFLTNGILGFKDDMLNVFVSFAMIGIGAYISVKTSLEMMNE